MVRFHVLPNSEVQFCGTTEHYYTNSSWHWGPYAVYGPVCHTICYIIHSWPKLFQSEHNWMHYMDIL